ncbi:NADH-quinone oxidoreductase subunit A [Anaerobacillus isosaccharinicus]|uniref:NADH-quinone oxidoreductase subunit A n=1 Tax=Anaerobacillus isosaccharinicus TaxID=1532552 RepID=A0A1S2M6L0_9BACI|nr:NADH-quinone oxidoreductase subunit A [Anaerobacillus isosaccharinicus]MBA5584373.1 NADH-quinone oxidoreductase subunit A [Anaerobacillus isosaccharinicus]QOY37233.1 NADH-quinone oxidoreductase subunit A [Anaerobacillus isosaccharinicus]
MDLDLYLNSYVYVIIFLLLGIALPVGGLTFGKLLRPHNPYPEKLVPYESGILPTGDAQVRFNVAYYIVALEFVIFDVETVFLYPWAVALDHLGWFGINAMLIFIVVLGLGLAYSWKKKVLEWN